MLLSWSPLNWNPHVCVWIVDSRRKMKESDFYWAASLIRRRHHWICCFKTILGEPKLMQQNLWDDESTFRLPHTWQWQQPQHKKVKFPPTWSWSISKWWSVHLVRVWCLFSKQCRKQSSSIRILKPLIKSIF